MVQNYENWIYNTDNEFKRNKKLTFTYIIQRKAKNSTFSHATVFEINISYLLLQWFKYSFKFTKVRN